MQRNKFVLTCPSNVLAGKPSELRLEGLFSYRESRQARTSFLLAVLACGRRDVAYVTKATRHSSNRFS